MIQQHIVALSRPGRVPVDSVEHCLDHYGEAAPFLHNVLDRAADGRLRGVNDEFLFFRAIHIMAARRDTIGFEPLLRFLRRRESDELLGDATTHSLQRIAPSLFNGDARLLFAAIVSPDVDEYARSSLLSAASYLAWEGRIERDKMVELLTRTATERLAGDSDIIWFEWSEAIARLGLRELAPLVHEAAARGDLTDDLWLAEAFDLTLNEAERAPGDSQRFLSNFVGPMEDVVTLLQEFDGGAAETTAAASKAGWANEMTILTPAFNPWRHVGRNDPCPCGSGKKAKRCCLKA